MNLDKIRALCSAEKSNLSRLERDCGLSNAAIRRWGTNSPSAENVKKVADHFGVPVDYLLDREGYDVSVDAMRIASQFDALTNAQQELVKVYLSILCRTENSKETT